MELPEIPTHLPLFGHRIPIVHVPGLYDEDGEKAAGLADFATYRILVDIEGHSRAYQWTVVLHEWVHFLFYFQGRDALSDDEVLVDTTAQLLYQLIFRE